MLWEARMKRLATRRAAIVSVTIVVLFGLAGGIAYATIPSAGGVYTACRLNDVGTIRLIDPSLATSSLLSHCTRLETQIQWNQQGQRGDAGPPGTAGTNGTSPTVAQLAVGESHCPAGGAAVTDANGSTAYVCGGQNGVNGQPGKDFSGTFTSPDGRFALSVSDNGVQITGPDSSVSLPAAGGLNVSSSGRLRLVVNDYLLHVQRDADAEVFRNETHFVAHDRITVVDNDESVHVKHDRTQVVDRNESVAIGGARNEDVGSSLSVSAGGAVELRGSVVGLNSGSACRPVARSGDSVSGAGLIVTGSPTVCAGP
jgi:hypothetical protein